MAQNILLLGVDGGGSKTHAVLSDETGREIGSGAAGPSNYQYVGLVRAAQAIDTAIQQAFDQAGLERRPADFAGFGLGGIDTPQEIAEMKRWVIQRGWAHSFVIVNDGMLPIYAACPDGEGIGVVAGTGTIVWAATREGRVARASGWGCLMGDEGGGYWLGHETLRHIARAADGRGPGTLLTDRVLAHWQLPNPHALIAHVYGRQWEPSEIAPLARVLLACAETGDAVALSIARAGADELALSAATGMRKVGLKPPLALACTGSLLVRNAFYRALFAEAVQRHIGEADLRVVEAPVIGAVAAARLLQAGRLASGHSDWQAVVLSSQKNVIEERSSPPQVA